MSGKSFLRIPLTNYGEILEHSYDIVILPWGAVEPHNYHLPYLTDCILSYEIACDCADKVLEKGVTCMVMPPVYFGSQNAGQWNKSFCVHTRSETQKAILVDIVTSLYGQGFRKMVIINGHGGNTLKPYVRDLAMSFPDFRLIVVDCDHRAAGPHDFAHRGAADPPARDAADEDRLAAEVHIECHGPFSPLFLSAGPRFGLRRAGYAARLLRSRCCRASRR